MGEQRAERLTRVNVPALDDILGESFPVLDDGFIRVIDYMGDEAAIVQAARVSYGPGTKKMSNDRNLLRYLMRHQHTSPFEMTELKLHVRVPMDAWRQWIRHRTASVNETSTRYSIAIDARQMTDPNEWRYQSQDNKQGSEGFFPEKEGRELSLEEVELHKRILEVYGHRLDIGVAREQARKDLPLSTYTEAYWKIDGKNLLHFLGLRMEEHAQKEIRDYARVIGEKIVAPWMPTVWQAFKDYQFEAMKLSSLDQRAVQLVARGEYDLGDPQLYVAAGFVRHERLVEKNRESQECRNKLELLFQIE